MMAALTEDQRAVLSLISKEPARHRDWVVAHDGLKHAIEIAHMPDELIEWSNEGDVRLSDVGKIVLRYLV
jgi:hypothetical protein